MDQAVRVQIEKDAAVVRLERPSFANAINRKMAVELRRQLAALDAAPEVKAMILTGAGSRAFCAGLDLKERSQMTEEEIAYSRKFELFPLFFDMEKIETPLIAAVNGAAIGGGAELVLACDIRIATAHATFRIPETKWGIIPAAGAIQRLPQIAGAGIARELILTGRTISAEQAKHYGIFNHVVEADTLMESAMQICEEIGGNASMAVKRAKAALNFRDSVYYGMWFDIMSSENCYQCADRAEGTQAFVAKRKPIWTDRK